MFCKKCGGLMLPAKDKHATKCASCGHQEKAGAGSQLRVSEQGKRTEEIAVIEKNQERETLPKMKATCNKCNNNEAFYWHIQTRAADEPETRFNRCTKCGHTWRSYG